MSDPSLRKMILSSDETEKMVTELGRPPLNLSRSAVYRIGAKMLYEYLIHDKLPDEEKDSSHAEPDQG